MRVLHRTCLLRGILCLLPSQYIGIEEPLALDLTGYQSAKLFGFLSQLYFLVGLGALLFVVGCTWRYQSMCGQIVLKKRCMDVLFACVHAGL